MKASKSWPWVLGAAIAGVGVGLLLGRTGQAAPGRIDSAPPTSRTARAPSTVVTPSPAGPVSESSPSASRRPGSSSAAPSAKAAPAEPVAAENTTDAAPPPDDWQKIPIDKAFGESLGSWENRKAFAKGMKAVDPFFSCVRAWKAPAHLDKLEIETELRLRSEEGALVVEDRLMLEGNVSDAGLEECLISGSRGRRIPIPGIEPGRQYRINWGGMAALH
ncbi:MAG: hypothetical protein WB493_04510 [Anaeromyxobacteraceae bacterium]